MMSGCSDFQGYGRYAYRCWTRWKPWRDGTGTKMTIAFLPWPTSIYSDQSQRAISFVTRSAAGPKPNRAPTPHRPFSISRGSLRCARPLSSFGCTLRELARRKVWARHHIAGSPVCTKNTPDPMSRRCQIVYSDESLFRLIVCFQTAKP